MIFDPLFAVLEYHNIDPEILRFGPIAIRWYSLAYVAGLFGGWWWMTKYTKYEDTPYFRLQLDEFAFFALLGVILGGRLGYILFYKPMDYLADPISIFKVWEGGMSFHGGLLGVMLAIWYFTKSRKISIHRFSDYVACTVPIGLFFGRVANFINGELWGGPSDLPWAMKFPTGGDIGRHPSQLYEAGLEGLTLFIVLNFLMRRTAARFYPGMIVGCFFVGYGFFRYLIEFVRVPDEFLGRLWNVISMGQLLSLPMMAFGLYLILRAVKKGPQVYKSKGK